MPEPNEDWICLGVIAAPHGVRGDVRIRSYTERPEDIAAYGPLTDDAGRVWQLRIKSRSKSGFVASLDGVRDRDAAERLKGQKLHVARAALPELEEEDSYYHADLIGLRVELAGGGTAGTIAAVHDFGAGVLLEIAREGEASALIPFTAEAVPSVDIAGGKVVVAAATEFLAEAEETTG
jgi:16S rRNA processing protein RimM